MPERISFEDIAPSRTETLTVEEFLALAPFPGHRNSVDRAPRAAHLHTFIPEHINVDLGEYLDDKGEVRLVRITGNTRAEVWRRGLSDRVPTHVKATIYTYGSVEEVRAAGLRFDSPEAAWRPADYAYRAHGMTFSNGWRPRSPEGKSPRLSRAVRLAAAYESAHYEPDRAASQIEFVMPDWAAEITKLDRACETPISAADANFSTGMQAGCLLLFRYEGEQQVEDFIRMARSDEGTKNCDGLDGPMQLAEVMKSRGRGARKGRSGKRIDLDDCKKCLTAFDCHKKGLRQSRVGTRVDPVAYVRNQRDNRSRQRKVV